MKKLFALAAITLFGAPVFAEPEITRWNSAHSMGCMMTRECTNDVRQAKNVDELEAQLNVYFNDENRAELKRLFNSFNDIGIEFFTAKNDYFMTRTRGVYYTVGNKFFLNTKYMTSEEAVMKVIRHEGWHAAQDCMAGSIENSQIAVIWNDGVVPNGYVVRANVAYAMQPAAIPWESEAIWAGDTPHQTAAALEACASPEGAMWDIYTPTPMTGEWLIREGYWNGETK